ncbi:AAA family ATPase [Chloroflexota bacterium]
MVALYVTSSEAGNGKTTICAGLGKHLLDDGKKVGYFKPITDEGNANSDAEFMKNLLNLEGPANAISPIISGNKVKEAYDKISKDKDIVIIEASHEWNKASEEIVKSLNAKIIAIESYSKDLSKVMNNYKDSGKSLVGIIINKVPKNLLERVQDEIAAQSNTNVLGIIPEDRTLFALTMGELTLYIQGEILKGADKSDELVENIMAGAMIVDTGPDYFGIKDNKAVIIKSDRPDMQMAAMETSTTCLILTGDTDPIELVLNRADEKDIPIITTKNSITDVAADIEGALNKTRFCQDNKLPRLDEILTQNLDFKTVYKALA